MNYQPALDALRALAVLPVAFNHIPVTTQHVKHGAVVDFFRFKWLASYNATHIRGTKCRRDKYQSCVVDETLADVLKSGV